MRSLRQQLKCVLMAICIIVFLYIAFYVSVRMILRYQASSHIAGTSVTPQLRQILNEAYGIVDLSSGVQIVEVNLQGPRDYTLYTHYIMSENDWQYVESVILHQSYIPIEEGRRDNRIENWWGADEMQSNLGPENLAVVESAYELNNNSDGSYLMIFQCYPVDGLYSVYMLATDERFPPRIWDFF